MTRYLFPSIRTASKPPTRETRYGLSWTKPTAEASLMVTSSIPWRKPSTSLLNQSGHAAWSMRLKREAASFPYPFRPSPHLSMTHRSMTHDPLSRSPIALSPCHPKPPRPEKSPPTPTSSRWAELPAATVPSRAPVVLSPVPRTALAAAAVPP